MGFDISSFQRMVIEIAISKFTRNSEVQETDQRLKFKLNFILYNKPCQSRPSNSSGPFLGFLEPTRKKMDRLALTGWPFASRHATRISPSLIKAYIGVPCGWTPASKLPVNSIYESPRDNTLIIRRCSLDTHRPASGDQTCSLRCKFRSW